LIAPQDAFKLILKHVVPVEKETRPLDKALGYYLGEDIRADRDIPPADRSAMDGYAVRSANLATRPCALRLIGEVAAGSPARPRVRPGTCVRVLTGANIPPGADTVVMVEQTEQTNGLVTIKGMVKAGSNILGRGEDAKEGERLLSRGTVLGPQQVGVCAAVGKAEVKVYRRPRVAVLCTGEELREVDAPVRPHEIRNSNGPALCAALKHWGYPQLTQQNGPDDVNVLAAKLRRLRDKYDVVILTGGVSVGKYDLVREAVERVGAVVRFHGVAMKPGKPVLYATLPGNRQIFGLPGNPLSAMTGFHEFVLPALRRMSGVHPAEAKVSLHLPLASQLTSKGGPMRFALACMTWNKGCPTVTPIRSHSSADLVAGGRCDGAIVVPPHVRRLPARAVVEFHPWRPLP